MLAADLESQGKGEEAEQGTDELIEEYQEVLGSHWRKKNPSLAALFAPFVPALEEVQGGLLKGETLLKYQWVHDHLPDLEN